MSHDFTKRLVESAMSADKPCPCKKCGAAMKEGRCTECGFKEDSELQMYATEPSGGMAEAVLTVEDVEKLCPECAESMRKRNVSGVKLKSVIESGIFEEAADDDPEAVLIEKDEDGWPKKLKKGRFTKYCKGEGFDGPSEACAKKAMQSDDSSVRGMASFYMNTVKPKGKTASAVKGAEECNEPEDVEEGLLGAGIGAGVAAGKELAKAKAKAKKESYDEGVSEMIGVDAVRAWAKHSLPEGVRMTQRTVLIGNTRVAERHVDSKHARVLKPGSLTEDSHKRARDIIERGLRDAGYNVELVDGFTR